MKVLVVCSELRRAAARVALITRTKDRPILLQRAVQSVLNQTFADWLHVVVNDGGDPAPVRELLERFAPQYDGRVVFLSADESMGMEAASNAGIRNSSSEFLLIHDDDDSLEPAFLERAIAYLDAATWPTVAGVTTLSKLIYERLEDGRPVEQGRTLYRPLTGCVGIAEMAEVNQFAPISFLYRRAVIDEIGLYDERLPVLGDWDFNLRFLAHYDIGVLPEALANYHQRPAVDSEQYGNSLFAQRERHAFFDRIVRNAHLRGVQAQGLPVIGLLMNLSSGGTRPASRRRLFDPVYRIPGVTALVRSLRRRGYLLRLTRDV